MARASKSVVLSSLRGALGDIVIRKTRNGVVISKKPARRKGKLPEAQRQCCNRFVEAVAHAKKVLAEFKRENPGVRTIRKGKSIYHAAMREYLKKK